MLIPVELDSNILNKFFHLKIADGKFMVDREEIVYESVSHVFKERLIIGIFFFLKEVISKVGKYFTPIPWLQEKFETRPTWCVTTNG